ncbi:MAG: hypothetical protein IT347_05950 [Candidatus Eisenbacteria bacterium]|nr:hypothetical protein [Candidatus Eisenbacteria bacterium]
MRARLAALLFAALALGAVATAADAKRFRYASGPKAPADSALAVANPYLDPVVRSRGPRVPYTNLQLAGFVADSAISAGLAGAPLESGVRVVVAPTHDHSLNFLIEDALVEQLTRRGLQVVIRRTPIPDDSLATLFAGAGDPIVEYTLASVKVTYLRLVGFLPGRVKIERQVLVQGTLGLREPVGSRVLWSNRFAQNFVDRFSRSQVALVEDPQRPELKDTPPSRNVDKVFEPVLVVAVVGGLVALFFQNRP